MSIKHVLFRLFALLAFIALGAVLGFITYGGSHISSHLAEINRLFSMFFCACCGILLWLGYIVVDAINYKNRDALIWRIDLWLIGIFLLSPLLVIRWIFVIN